MSENWLPSEFALDLLMVIIIYAISGAEVLKLKNTVVGKVVFIGADLPLSPEEQTVISFILLIVLSFLLFSSILPVILGLMVDTKEQVNKLLN